MTDTIETIEALEALVLERNGEQRRVLKVISSTGAAGFADFPDIDYAPSLGGVARNHLIGANPYAVEAIWSKMRQAGVPTHRGSRLLAYLHHTGQRICLVANHALKLNLLRGRLVTGLKKCDLRTETLPLLLCRLLLIGKLGRLECVLLLLDRDLWWLGDKGGWH